MDPPPNSQELIQQFCALTHVSPVDAPILLSACDWDLEISVATYFESQGISDDDGHSEDFNYGEANDASDDHTRPIPTTASNPSRGAGSSARQSSNSGTGRTTGSSSSRGAAGSSRQGAAGGIRTLRDIGGDAEGEDDDDEKDPNYFAGGEKSGLAVQGSGPPSAQDAIQGILDRARRNLPRPGGDDEPPRTSRFTGRGVTLGGDDAPSEVVVEPQTARATPSRERVRRVLHLWSDGFSVDDGDLYRYDDPANSAALESINSGRAPLHLLNVQPNQEVDLEVDSQKESKYVRPKAIYKPFGGQGQRLGSPTPGVSSTPPTISATVPTPATSSKSKAPEANIDESVPTIVLQIRLGDGTRLQSRFNTTHTVGDVYNFVARAQPTQRAYALMTTFPSKELIDKSAVLGELSDFKRGGVVVQKWT